MQQCARQQAGFGQYLETIANTQHITAFCGKLDHFLHNRRKTGDSARAQIIAKRKAAGQNNKINALQIMVFMPQAVLPAGP